MSVETPSFFAQVIQDHLELKRRNAALERQMPISGYIAQDPFDNHPLFKTEEQARVEDTLSGQDSIEAAPTSLDWPTEEAFAQERQEPESESDEGLWTRSRDFDWGD